MSERLRDESGRDAIEIGTDLLTEAHAATNVAVGGAANRPYLGLADAESDLRKEFESLSDRVYLEGRDDAFSLAVVRSSALRVAAGALRLAAMCGLPAARGGTA